MSDVSIYQAEMLIFLDETGADRRDSLKHCFLTSCPLMEKNPHSVVIMGNCIIHHDHKFVKISHEMRALIHFSPVQLLALIRESHMT